MRNNILTVTEVNSYIKRLVSGDILLSALYVKGEISNFTHHSSGHLYFTLKDNGGIIKCVMFASRSRTLAFKPKDGEKVTACGQISVYEKGGQYQLNVESMELDGLGHLFLAFEQLKERLSLEGLFDASKKKKIPLLPERIGVITSPTGAVIRDIINVLYRRYPNARLKLLPTAVQGEGAAIQIANAIKKLNEWKCVDVIIIARGGGSLEELWPFNEECVARSIYESEVPVISAVGHETDFSISDFVSDMRAPTPSAAAEMVMPEKSALLYTIHQYEDRLRRALINRLEICRVKLDRLINSYAFVQPYDRLRQEQQRLDLLERDLQKGMRQTLEGKHKELRLLTEKLDALSPLKVLNRGYGLLNDSKTNKTIASVEHTEIGQQVNITMKDGMLTCEVLNKSQKSK